ncbi:MAG: crossover junction endodeoxyribonuclease RuvC [Candidatus Zixiibacteriota bacterium]|nr:MAG: crossover junction endodeoxyribonuclease RuvC [candidate division Zixibacteria bacterium]
MTVLGIDPGLNITGYGVLQVHDANGSGITLIEAGVIRTQQSETTARRLLEIASEIEGIMAQFKPDAMAIEDLYSHYQHPKTAIIMGHARGVVFLKAAEAGIEVFSYASTRIKKSLTGNGRASKAQMQRMVQSTLQLPTIPEPPDAADALAIALCHCRSLHQQAVFS